MPVINDPRGWFKDHGVGYVQDDDYYLSILRAASNEKGYEKISRDGLRRSDVVQAKVTFDPYRVGTKIAGIRLQLEELMVIRSARDGIVIKVSFVYENCSN
jgi:hypothetical protein